ncbi:hypothetical protein BGZ97_009197 [Linnemannia gamsii]|uniref:Uncharacterized protein n=1 Tax=Linnemannia gamsii TaxID=64522 RepID=A0A9P6QLK4_9FUNG|nr:hypothetical protein BGZ97_009197 [Linnemannia gamsii]
MTRELDPDRFELLKSEYSDVRVLVSKGVHPFAACVRALFISRDNSPLTQTTFLL